MSQKTRITSIEVELVQVLGTILRDHLKLQPHGSECWTFTHDYNYNIAPEEERDPETDIYCGVEHEVSVYLTEGYLPVMNSGKIEKVELRVHCELCKWVPTALSFWIFQFWLKPENGEVKGYYFECHREYGWNRDIHLNESKVVSPFPPQEIAFKGQPSSAVYRTVRTKLNRGWMERNGIKARLDVQSHFGPGANPVMHFGTKDCYPEESAVKCNTRPDDFACPPDAEYQIEKTGEGEIFIRIFVKEMPDSPVLEWIFPSAVNALDNTYKEFVRGL